MSLLCRRILHTLAAFMVAGAQVFGMQQGYVCDHVGAALQTPAEHCHYAETAGKPDFSPCTQSPHDEDHDSENQVPHAPLSVELNASTTGLATAPLPVFIAVLVAVIPAHDWMLISTLLAHEMTKPPQVADDDDASPAAVQVLGCMVMRV